MKWQDYKEELKHQPLKENQFILGLDLGESTTHISYLHSVHQEPEIIDLSGGYGKTSVPTLLQFLPSTNEWVIGEYAALNQGIEDGDTFSHLISKLGENKHIEVDGEVKTISYLLSIFLKDLIKHCSYINPQATVIGITVTVPTTFSKEEADELKQAFKLAGLENQLISFAPEREALLQYFHFKDAFKNDEKILLLDFSDRGLRGDILDVLEVSSDRLSTHCCGTLISNDISTHLLDQELETLIQEAFTNGNENEIDLLPDITKSKIKSYLYEHKEILYQSLITRRDAVLYFNFAFPPQKSNISVEVIENLIRPVQLNIKEFISSLLSQAKHDKHSIDRVLLTGGGFELQWTIDFIEHLFDASIIHNSQPVKASLAKGAVLMTADSLEVMDLPTIEISDKQQLPFDIGIKATQDSKETFIPIIEKNTFTWQKPPLQTFIMNKQRNEHTKITLLKRENEILSPLDTISLDDLEIRDIMKLSFDCHLEEEQIEIVIRDEGFGEFFPQTDYEKSYFLHI